ncbi:MAG: InlB B-repeat-containing protein, partial [Nitrososphaerota archaeon]|nr:InlB B-repeat-containing protein [Nitrososphaerota archaeon]
VQPANPNKVGSEFVEWQLNGVAFDFGTAITEDITLVASWDKVPVVYMVTFDSNGGSAVDSQAVEENTKAVQPANPNKVGSEFVEWQLNGVAFDFGTAITEDITLVASWKKSPITVVSATPTASVEKLNGNKNNLTITITEKLSDGTTNTITKTFSINNNAADTYTVSNYRVYVDTKGNTQIRACYII